MSKRKRSSIPRFSIPKEQKSESKPSIFTKIMSPRSKNEETMRTKAKKTPSLERCQSDLSLLSDDLISCPKTTTDTSISFSTGTEKRNSIKREKKANDDTFILRAGRTRSDGNNASNRQKLRKSLDLSQSQGLISGPKRTIRMTDEEKMQYIAAVNAKRKPTLPPKRTDSGPVRYKRLRDSQPDIATVIESFQIARSPWKARDKAEIDVLPGDKLFFENVESSWVFGYIVGSKNSEKNEKYNEPLKGWFPLSVLLKSGSTPSATLELRSPNIVKEKEEIVSSIIENKKRFALRLEVFFDSRVSQESLVMGNILQDFLEDSMEVYASIPRPPPLPELPPIQEAIRKFNVHARKGIEYIIEKSVIDDTSPIGIANMLMNEKAIDKHVLGDYLGDGGEMNGKIRDCIFDSLDFRFLEYGMALRRFLDVFHLPGEAQKIDRLMQAFATKFYAQQDGIFLSSDAAYILAFSTVMLNTDLHNPSVKRKMTREQFVSQNRGVNEGENFPREFLEDLYDEIEEDEMRGHNVLPGAFKRGWLGLHFIKDAVAQKYKRAWVMMDKNGIYCFKSQDEFRATCTIPLKLITSAGRTKKPFEFRVKIKSVSNQKTRYTFIAKTDRARDSWLAALQLLRTRVAQVVPVKPQK